MSRVGSKATVAFSVAKLTLGLVDAVELAQGALVARHATGAGHAGDRQLECRLFVGHRRSVASRRLTSARAAPAWQALTRLMRVFPRPSPTIPRGSTRRRRAGERTRRRRKEYHRSMPELPEAEVCARGLARLVAGYTIDTARCTQPGRIATPARDADGVGRTASPAAPSPPSTGTASVSSCGSTTATALVFGFGLWAEVTVSDAEPDALHGAVLWLVGRADGGVRRALAFNASRALHPGRRSLGAGAGAAALRRPRRARRRRRAGRVWRAVARHSRRSSWTSATSSASATGTATRSSGRRASTRASRPALWRRRSGRAWRRRCTAC